MVTVSDIIKGDRLHQTYGNRHTPRTSGYGLKKKLNHQEKIRISKRSELTDLCREKLAELRSEDQRNREDEFALMLKNYERMSMDEQLWFDENEQKLQDAINKPYEEFRALWKERNSLTKRTINFSYYCGLD